MKKNVPPRFELPPAIKSLATQLDKEKISFRNKNRLKISSLLSFLDVSFTTPESFLGKGNGWTCYYNDEYRIRIDGAFPRGLGGVEYLANIQVEGAKLENVYNDYVTIFALWDFLNEDGRVYALSVYAEDIQKLKSKKTAEINAAQKALDDIVNAEQALSQSLCSKSS